MRKAIFSKKHYEAIAGTLRQSYVSEVVDKGAYDHWMHSRWLFADMLDSDNAAFKRDKFMSACWPTPLAKS